jgi:AraC family transcriptional regulator, exoenzyme S synthesis regulatory protein ExsA
MIDVFEDGRLVLSGGEDISMIYYRQEEDTEKAHLLLKENILCFLLHGHKTVWHPHGKLQIQPGEGFFLARGNYLRAERKMDPQLGYQSLVVRLSDAFLLSLEEAFSSGEQAVSQAFHLREDVLVKNLVQQLVQYFQAPEEKKRVESLLSLKMRELLLLLLSAGGNKGFDAVIKSLPSHKEPSLVALMEAHFRETLTLEQWAFLAGLSLSSFKRKFEVTYHMPPRRWIQQRRLEEANYLLGSRRMNVTEVCFSVGFENLAHFVHAFKEKYHITPKQRQVAESAAI